MSYNKEHFWAWNWIVISLEFLTSSRATEGVFVNLHNYVLFIISIFLKRPLSTNYCENGNDATGSNNTWYFIACKEPYHLNLETPLFEHVRSTKQVSLNVVSII